MCLNFSSNIVREADTFWLMSRMLFIQTTFSRSHKTEFKLKIMKALLVDKIIST